MLRALFEASLGRRGFKPPAALSLRQPTSPLDIRSFQRFFTSHHSTQRISPSRKRSIFRASRWLPVWPRPRWSRFNSTTPPPPPNSTTPSSLSLSQRLRKLSREYGYSALGVYLVLSALDFPLCFLAVRHLGTEKIGHWEHVALEKFWQIVPFPRPSSTTASSPSNDDVEEVEVVEGSIQEAQRHAEADASIWTQLALAYAIHKSFIFIRVPLTAAVTPKVVRVLRGWGWDIGKARSKLSKAKALGKTGKDG
ncbi:MAG: hypothetical protein M1823_001306 [Watsoniomyces obsoletus]|nr:MAG: hypothetical protein M1823_001306 [Watsoniomyces obsoletus]